MEKIRINKEELEIISINQKANLLELEFPQVTDLKNKDLSKIELYTSGGVQCAALIDYSTIYKTEGEKVILSNDWSVYEEPVEPTPIEPYIPSEKEIARQEAITEIANLKIELTATDYQIIKCSEYQLNQMEAPYDIAALHLARQEIRDKINELEISLNA